MHASATGDEMPPGACRPAPQAPPAVCPPDVRADAGGELASLRSERAELQAMSHAVSHELRSPLGAILILSSLLTQECGPALDDQGRELLRRLTDCARSTVALMDRLLVLHRAAEQELAPVAVDLRATVQAVYAEQASQHAGPLPELVVHELPGLVADPALLRLLLANLLANAVKCSAGRAGARIEVAGSASGDEALFHVRDHGVGFDPRMAERLFTLFGHVHSQVQFPGAGIGLALVQRIARRHGGRVWAEGAPEQGATFHVALPRVPRQVVCTAGAAGAAE